jgi:hypothetical protein
MAVLAETPATWIGVVQVKITPGELAGCEPLARAAEIGGQSNIRNGDDRRRTLVEDQLVGQVTALAGCKMLLGTALGHYAYKLSRWAADRNPTMGDGGEDIPLSNVDFKGSLRRTAKTPQEHHLLVRPRERHPGWIYYAALVEPDFLTVSFFGWLADYELPPAEADGPFEGAHAVVGWALHPCPDIRWRV